TGTGSNQDITRIESGTDVNIPIGPVKAGDTITFTATLTTTDPNENGEGEALEIRSSGGFSLTIPTYAQARKISFTATVDGETVTAFIDDYDAVETGYIHLKCGDEDDREEQPFVNG